MTELLYPTHARVLLENIRFNLEGIRKHCGTGPTVLIAVKANGYGHGAVDVARMTQETGAAQWLGVATVPEAIELRQAGITLPILKFSAALTEAEIVACLAHDVTLAVPSADAAHLVVDIASREMRTARVHLKVDTGMRRIGVGADEAADVAQMLEDAVDVHLEGIFTHLPVSDAPAHDEFTDAQIDRFHDIVDAVESRLGRPLEFVHSANSGGVLGHPSALGGGRIDPRRIMVRPGIMIYGHYPDTTTPHTIELRPGMELRSVVSHLKPVAAGETVGYGRTWTAPRDTWIATIPVGYADGMSRLLSNRGRVLIGGRAYPIAGRVCMDQTMIDVGPDPVVHLGDDVVWMGRDGDQEITCAEIADLMGTITYEVTCLIPPRVTRVPVR